jgi:hypothetical protein
MIRAPLTHMITKPTNRLRARAPVLVALALVTLLTNSACSRNVRVDSEPGGGYSLAVRNTMPHEMVVSYDDGSGQRVLGTVTSAATARFVIASPKSTEISVQATDEGRTHTRSYTVSLVSGTPSDVTIR